MMLESLGIGLQLTVYGMGLVFLLLAALWGLMSILLRLDQTPSAAPESETAASQTVEPTGLDADTLAAITIALMLHRRIRRKQAAPALRTHQPGTLPSRWVGSGRTRQNQTWQPKR